MSDDELLELLQQATLAVTRLGEALALPETEIVRDAAIQRFEFAFEQGWKTAMRFARREGQECASPRQTIRAAFKLGWIEDDALWLSMLDDRNRTAHTYHEPTAKVIYGRLSGHYQALTKLLATLRATLTETDDVDKQDLEG